MQIREIKLSPWSTIENLQQRLSKYKKSTLIKDNENPKNIFLYELINSSFDKYGIGLVNSNNYNPKILAVNGKIFIGSDNCVHMLSQDLYLERKISLLSPFYDFVFFSDNNIVVSIFEIDVIGISAVNGDKLWEFNSMDIITDYIGLDQMLRIKTFEGKKLEICILNGKVTT